MHKSSLPTVTIVVIGLNTEETLQACLSATQQLDYPKEKYRVLYVDTGSTDHSLTMARRFTEVEAVALHPEFPSAALGRNTGWQKADTTFIQFLDSDTEMDPQWLRTALENIDDDIGAIFGKLEEKEPRKNLYHLISHLEWEEPKESPKIFGGNVLIRKAAIDEVGGYDEALQCGEEPELSVRMREAGWKIKGLPHLMAKHDIGMKGINKYLRRAFRSGYGFLEVALLCRDKQEKLWLWEVCRVMLFTFIPWILLAVGYFSELFFPAAAIALLIFFRPLRHAPALKRKKNLSWKEAILYCLHLSFVSYPQCLGAFYYLAKKLKKVAFKEKTVDKIREKLHEDTPHD